MNRIESIFGELRGSGGKALMPFVCAGYPAPGLLGETLEAVEGAGARIAEVGIPFSDPIADGPVIASAMHEALEGGTTPEGVLEEIASIRARARVSLGLVGMVSISIVRRAGGEAGFCERCARAGLDGLIVPDLPAEESAALVSAARGCGLTVSQMVAPTTSEARAKRIVSASTGFVYVLARAGITGERGGAPDVEGQVSRLRGLTDLPLACGFGISSAEQVRAVVAHADAAIVGSAVVRRMGEAAARGEDPGEAAGSLVGELSRGISGEG